MTFEDRWQHLNRIHFFIQRKATGKPQELANKLGISVASLYRYIRILKNSDASIVYDKDRASYVYEDEFKMDKEDIALNDIFEKNTKIK